MFTSESTETAEPAEAAKPAKAKFNLRETLAFLGGGHSLNLEQRHLLTIHLEIMLRCGITLVHALQVLSRQADAKPAHCAELLARDVEKGLKFSEALARQPENFSETYVRVMAAAEESGTLTTSLNRLADGLGKQLHTKATLKGALIYPFFLLAGCGTLITVMLYFVFPMVIAVTQDAGVEPPALTKLLMNLTKPSVGLALLLSSLLLTSVSVAALRSPRWGPKVRSWFEAHTPIGKFYVRIQILESTRQLSLLIGNGVDLLRSLKFAGRVGAQSVLLGEAYDDIIQRTRMGQDLHSSYGLHDVFPTMLSSMLAVSAEAGQTTEMLDHFCHVLEDDLNTRLRDVTSALEPIMLGVLGSVIGVLLIAAFMPIYNLIQV
jgi:type IV pilus assembly protein PilC